VSVQHEQLRARRGSRYAEKFLGMEGEAAQAYAWLPAEQQITVENATRRLNDNLRQGLRGGSPCIYTRREREARSVYGTAGDPVCGCDICAPMEG
jgi:hypothetical protein